MSFEIDGDFSIQAAIDSQAQRRKEETALGRTDFLTMLVAQLENQDPLNPQDASAFSAQLAQFSSLEQLISMKASLDKLLDAQITGAEKRNVLAEDLVAANLLDKEVAVFDDRLEVPAAGETQIIDFYLDGIANKVDLKVRDESGGFLYTISAVRPSTDGSGGSLAWQRGMNSFEWQRPAGGDDYVRGPRDVFFDVLATMGGKDVRGEGVSIGIVVSSSMGFDATVLELADGRRIDLENVFEVRRDSSGI